MASRTEQVAWLKDAMAGYLRIPKREDIPTWAAHSFYLPSETSEPGLYSPHRAPYQIEVLKAMSPRSKVREITLAWGAQQGKTICEQIGMNYYMSCYPRPQAFAFSNDGELKAFVKTKFNPFLVANPDIRRILGKGSRTSGDTLDEKLYPGGFLRFIAANTEANMRSYSIAVLFADEIDTYPDNVGGNGDPLIQLRNRTNVFHDTCKMVFSSTPANDRSKILERLEQSTYRKYFLKCPHCGHMFSLEFEDFHYATNEEGKAVTDAWFECPECGLVLHDGDKTELLKPENGAQWIATNPSAPPDREGFFLPSFYSPVGWISWETIAQEYVDCLNAPDDKRLTLLTAFYNTKLCRQYHEAGDKPKMKPLLQRGADSMYRRGIAPRWVDVVTTGADVQKNRIEITVMGWGARMRHIPIDHLILTLPQCEEVTDLNGTIWREYRDKVLNGLWEREDGYVLTSVANALDRGYESRTVDNLARMFADPRFHPVRGVSNPKETSVAPSRKQTRAFRGDQDPVEYFDLPVDQLKKVVYQSLLESRTIDNYLYTDFPSGYSTEFFDQLLSERLALNAKTGFEQWEKTRDRNEVLDCFVYNFAMAYLLGLDSWTDEDWETIAQSHSQDKDAVPEEVRTDARALRRRRGVLSPGIPYSIGR